MPMLMLVLLLLLAPLAAAAADAAAQGRCTVVTALKTYSKCIALPSQGASLAWTLDPANATLDVAFTGAFISPSGWVAWGINPDAPVMTGSRVLAAFADPSTGSLIVLPFVLTPDVKLQSSPLISRPLDIPLLASSVSLALPSSRSGVRDGAAVQIFATLRVPNGTKLHFVWNRGLYVQGYSPTIHPTDVGDLSSTATVDMVTTATEAAPAISSTLRWTHGAINAVSWGIILPVGLAVARYLRPCTSIGPTWFYAHAVIQSGAYLAGAAGFAIGMVMGAATPDETYPLHRGLGVAAVVTGGLQAAALLFRPKTTNRYRKYWKSYHHLVGYGCVVLGVVNVFQGFEVMGLGSSYWKLGYCLALATVTGVCVALEVNAWVVFYSKAEEERPRKEQRSVGGGGYGSETPSAMMAAANGKMVL